MVILNFDVFLGQYENTQLQANYHFLQIPTPLKFFSKLCSWCLSFFASWSVARDTSLGMRSWVHASLGNYMSS